GRLEIDTELKGLDRLQRNIESSSNKISLALIVSAILVSSSLVVANQIGPTWHGVSVLGLSGYVLAGLIGVRIAWATIGRF
ncbi:MAG: hypothetical protein KDC38_17830, partial [Planctomycetes bacterium]|nr:hypothetical protein [Planctomycetota bacterium]